MLLKEAGFDDHGVCLVTSHSNFNSPSGYSLPEESMEKMATALDTTGKRGREKERETERGNEKRG